MQTVKDLFERLKTDEAFAKEFSDAVQAKGAPDADNIYGALIMTAEEYGYTVTKEDIDEFVNSQDIELDAEELGKAAGGTVLTLVLASGGALAFASGVLSVSVLVTKEHED